MQVTPVPMPVLPNALPQDAARAIPQVQAQATAPLIQRAVDPSPRGERGNQPRSNGDRAKGGDRGRGGESGNRGGSGSGVNIRV